jgi:hypothetical protein
MKTWTVAVSENANISPNEAIKWCVDESNDFSTKEVAVKFAVEKMKSGHRVKVLWRDTSGEEDALSDEELIFMINEDKR